MTEQPANTSETPRSRTRLSNVASTIWLIVAALFLCVGIARVSLEDIDDDNIYLAYAAAPKSDDTKAIWTQFLDRATTDGCVEVAFRLNFRERYATNYMGQLLVGQAIYLASSLFQQSEVVKVVNAILLAKAFLFAASLGLLVFASARVQDPQLRLGLAFALVLLAAGDIAAHNWRIYTFPRVDATQPLSALAQTAYSFLFPYEGHSLFGLAARNAALAVFAAAMVLKWQNRMTLAAVAIFAVGILHTTYGGMGWALFVFMLTVSRPDSLRSWPTRLILATAVALYLFREHYFGENFALQLGLAVAAAILAIVVFQIIGSAWYQEIWGRLIGKWRRTEIMSDTAACVVFASVITVLCFIGARGADPIMRDYFWADLITRMWSFVHFPVFALAGYLAVSHWRISDRMALFMVAPAAALFFVYVAAKQVDYQAPGTQHRAVAAVLEERPSGTMHAIAEEVNLYAHLTMVALGVEAREKAESHLSLNRPMRCDWSSRPPPPSAPVAPTGPS